MDTKLRLDRIEQAIEVLSDRIEDGTWGDVRQEIRDILYPKPIRD